MAQGSKGAAGPANGQSVPSSVSAVPNGPPVNRKKQKRRQKQAAKDAAGALQQQQQQQQQRQPSNPPQHTHDAPHYQEFDDDDSEYGYASPDQPNGHVNGHPTDKKKPKKKKDKPDDQFTPDPSARPSIENVWNITKAEERDQIKAFWISLSDDERKSLLVLEKNSVLKTMRDTSARQTCSCTICGRRRIAIEAELEAMYEQYFNDLQECGCPDCAAKYQCCDRYPHTMPAVRNGAIHDEGFDEIDDDDDLYTDDGYREALRGPSGHSVASEMFHLGQNLAVKGTSYEYLFEIAPSLIGAPDGILTVADDLLKNEGKRFIDMMEQLAERRLAREEEAQYAAHHHPTHDSAYATSHDEHVEEDDDLDDDEDYDDEDLEGDEEEAAEVVGVPEDDAPANSDQDPMLEHDRIQEGRRMFHLFAARMFEQRVFVAYKAKVAHDRQQRLLMELEEEKSNDVQREAKKQRDAQKKKEKKKQQQQAKAEEKARKEAEKKAEEDAAKAEEARKQEEQRKKKEEQRKKKDAERRALEEERMRKEAERIKKQQEERERQLEAERSAREQKAAEKKAKDYLRRKEREDKETKEREAKEKKSQADKARREQEERAKAEKEAQERSRRETREAQATAVREAREAQAAKAARAAQAAREAQAQAQAQSQAQAAREAQAQAQAQVAATRRAAAPTPVAVPGLPRNPSSFSPHVAVATPVMPKAPTPVRPRAGSQQGSKGSSPRTPHVSAGSGKSVSPGEAHGQRKPSMQKLPLAPLQSAPPVHSIAPPPGMLPSLFNSSQPQNEFQPSGMSIRGAPPMFPLQAQAGASQYRPSQIPPPPGMAAPGLSSMNRILSEGPPGLVHPGPPGLGGPPIGQPQHTRQASGSSQYELMGAQPIQRPMGRSSSTKPEDGVDELSAQLGSSALMGDMDEPMPSDHRRPGPPGLAREGSSMSAFGASPLFAQGQRGDGFGPASSNASAWGTPPSTLPFSQPGVPTISPVGPGASASWGTPSAGWGAPAPGTLPTAASKNVGGGRPRPLTIRLHAANVFKRLVGAKLITADAWQDLGALLRHVDQCVSPLVSPQELLDICDTEGNEHNGGGEFQVRAPQQQVGGGIEGVQVRYVFDGAHDGGKEAPLGMGKAVGGDIGSPPIGVLGLAGGGSATAPSPGLFPGLGMFN
jgi:hypothetical protein